MAMFKCKMCGGDLALTEGSSVAQCEYCGSLQTVPNADDEKMLNMFARANRLRTNCEFDKAFGIYETIVADFPTEAEAYWGLVLCKYGIEYVDDPASHKKIPTCHRSSFNSVMEDTDFEQALENADAMARRVYREEAKVIEELRKGILEVSKNEEPYDIFICYKETDEKGERTLDSVLAQDLHDALVAKNYRVFFSRITLEDKLGQEYEPYIFAALNSAKVMLAIGTDYEYFNAVWVRNEWSRYLELMESDKNKHLIPCYKGIDAYDMPKEFAKLQAQDMGKVGATQDLLRGIDKLIVPTVTVTADPVEAKVEPLLKMGSEALERGEWGIATGNFDLVLTVNPTCADAYVGKLLAQYKYKKREDLAKAKKPLKKNDNYKQALAYASDALKAELEDYQKKVAKRSRQHLLITIASVLAVIALAFGINELRYPSMIQKFYADPVATASATSKQLSIWYWYKTPDECTQYMLNKKCQVYPETASFIEVTIPDGITSIGSGAFSGCFGLTSITIPDSVTNIGDYAFSDCTGLTSITIGDGVTNISKNTFYGCASLTSITIPDSVTSIGDYAFHGCTGLTSINIGNGVTSIGYSVFNGCTRLTSITIPDGVTSIGNYAFSGCSGLTNITIPDSVTSIGNYAFSGCSGLTNITIPKSVTSIGNYAFKNCVRLSSITIPESVTSISSYAFSGCTGLTSITIPDSITNIGDYAFSGCTGLTNITIPESVTSIGNYAFSDCTSLTNITILESVTSIGSYAFKNCVRLSSITIPESVTSIRDYAFDECNALGHVYYSGTKTQRKKIDVAMGNYRFTYAQWTYEYKG